jgi:hypothetical protein
MFDFALLLAIGLTSVELIVFGGGVIERAITVEACPIPPARAGGVPRLPGPPRLRTLRVLFGLATIGIAALSGLVMLFLAGMFPPEIGLPMLFGAFVLPFLRRRWSASARWNRALAEAQISDHAA